MIRFGELNRDHDRKGFDCGNELLNHFLKNMAHQNLKKGLSRTFVAYNDQKPNEILGFYTLSLLEVFAAKLPFKYAKKYRNKVPAVKLARLAVSKNRQRQGLGKHLIINSIKRVILISENAGIIGLFVDAKDEDAKEYYEKFDFLSLPDNPSELFLPLATLINLHQKVFKSK